MEICYCYSRITLYFDTFVAQFKRPMVGTIVNTVTIIIGSVVGSAMRRGIKKEYQQALYNAMGVASLALGANAFVQNMPKSQFPVLFIVSLSLGSLMGYMLRLDERFDTLVTKLQRNKSVEDSSTENSSTKLSEGLSTGILLYCIGTFSMLGPVLSALYGDNTYLYTNATLDLVTSAVLASTYGIGMVWAAPVLFCWQGAFYMVAKMSETAISADLMAELGIVGGTLIIVAGLKILGIKDCKTLNMLPSLLIPILFFALKNLQNIIS